MSFWYTEKPDELLLDLDDYDKPVQHFQIWGEMFRQRLRSAVLADLLTIRTTNGEADILLEESNTPNHFHVFIRLVRPMPLDQRLVWQQRLGSDWKRAHADLMRAARRIRPASLLIRTHKVDELWREPDYICPCPNGKHETLKQVELLKAGIGCPVWQELRGATPWELFGKPTHNGMELPVNLPLGRVPLEKILEVGQLKGDTDDGW